jgi:hypothetical protein
MPPQRLTVPIEVDLNSDRIILWEGDTTLERDAEIESGVGKVLLNLLPVPRFEYEFTRSTKRTIEEQLESITGKPRRIATMQVGDPIGPIRCQCTSINDAETGRVIEQCNVPPTTASISSAQFLVLNGPIIHGKAIEFQGTQHCGRLEASHDGVRVTMDKLSSEQPGDRKLLQFTHVVRCDFDASVPHLELQSLSKNLFRTLSLMKCGWVGLLGPWSFDSNGSLLTFQTKISKTKQNPGPPTWCHAMIDDSFSLLMPSLFKAFEDTQKQDALQTAFHWLVESQQCAGGVEGSIILQQSALECLAWFEVVQNRKLCSESGFKGLPATDKIRWLLSLSKINPAIPAKSTDISAYAREYNLSDLPEVLVDVRNALVHAEPKKMARILHRSDGSQERNELWYQVGGLLQQAFLASIDYQGRILRRDVVADWSTDAITPVPWASNGT